MDCLSMYNNLGEYIQKAFADQEKMLVYMHIPKAAGNSSISDMKAFKGMAFDIAWNDVNGSFQEFSDKLKSGEPYRMVSGHFREENVKLLRENNIPYNGVTFMRHPIQRLISEYRYMCTPAHPPHEQFMKNCPTFEHFAYGRVEPNVMAHILVGGAVSFDDYINKLKKRFTFIGLAEYYDLSMAVLLEAHGKRYTVKPRRNVTQKNEHNSFEVSLKTYERLMERHSLDVQVYEHLLKRYNKLSNDFIRRLFTPAPTKKN